MGTMTASPDNVRSAEPLTQAFEGPIKPARTSPLYLLGLLVVATAMVLLPLIYLALIGCATYGVYYHATKHVSLLGFGTVAGLVSFGKLVLYLGPLVIGGIVALFMVKPLFAPLPTREKRLSLVPENEPVLFAFVEKLCQTVGAPMPQRIDVICNVNATAGFRRGVWSMFSRDMVLTIGAPLVAGLSLRQFAGVLAHEFGHFTQGSAMRLDYTIRSVNFWFARVVYQRDKWDLKLITLSRDLANFTVILLIARLFVWLTRRVLWGLMFVGYMVSSVMSRQMEHNADDHEVRVAGSKAFGETMRRMELLLAAWGAASKALTEAWRNRRLGDNLPALLVVKADALSQKDLEEFREERRESENLISRLFSTHPSDEARIRRARKQDTEGVFRLEAPASVLFHDFDALCREATFAYYQEVLGPDLRRDNLIPTASLIRQQKRLTQREEAADRYFHGCLTPLRPLKLDRYSKVTKLSPQECLAKMKGARAALQKSFPIIRKSYDLYVKADEKAINARIAQEIFKMGFKRVDAKEFQLPTSSYEGALKSQRQAEKRKRDLTDNLTKVEDVVRLRLECALALLHTDQVASRIKHPDAVRRRADEMLDTLVQFESVSDMLMEICKEAFPLRAVACAPVFGEPDEGLIRQLLSLLESQQRQLLEIRMVLKEQPYPFEHADGRITLAQYAMSRTPTNRDLSGTIEATDEVLDQMGALYVRCLGELAQIAEHVEAALGLKPLKPEPDAEDEKKQEQPAT